MISASRLTLDLFCKSLADQASRAADGVQFPHVRHWPESRRGRKLEATRIGSTCGSLLLDPVLLL